MRKWMRHSLVLIGMAIIAMLSLSCERETWLIDDYAVGTGEPVQIRLAYQTPASDVVVTTRSLSSMDEHDIQDLYVLVFKRPNSGEDDLANWERVLTKDDVANSYFNAAALADGKKNYEPANGNWGSVTDEGATNATYGSVVVGAATTQCLIYAIANVAHGEDYSRASGSLKDDLDAIDDAGDLYALEASLNTQSLLNRDDRYLLMSGVFVNNSQKGNYNANYLKGTAGLVDLSTTGPVANIDVVDITSLGVVKLRRLSSHITFEIEVSDYFSEFRPESWQVVHVPTKTKMMDEGDAAMTAADRIMNDAYFTNGPLQTTMLHSEGKFYFDFYMFENHKQARNTDVDWYKTNYGLNIPATKQPNSDTDCAMLAKYANVDDGEELFKYAKRELELKETTGENLGKVFWNTSSGAKTNPTEEEQLQGSKQFVYVEPNATYVVIKGRLMLNGQSVRNLTLPDNSTNRIDVEAAYAEVTYVVHLGYAREQNIANQMAGNAGSADYKLQDFNSLRNTKYTYKIQIDGLNSIYTHVVAEGDDVETSKLMPGASGHFGVASDDVYNIDCHYNAFVIKLSQTQVENFHYEISTPFSNIKSTDESINTSDLDFSWIKVRFNGLEDGGNFWNNTGDGVSNAQLVQLYTRDVNDAANEDYNGHLYNLQQLEEFFDNNKTAWAHDHSGYDVYLSVYINEYFYDNPPTSQTSAWGNDPLLYWHNFVNTPARYVSFGKAQSSRHYTKDGESSQIAPELMIVQQSIQTHYSNSSTNGFGVEHSNETPNPRWYVVNAAEDGGNIATSGFSITNGWNNTWRFVHDMPWSKYVANTVNTTYHNLNMVASIGAQALKPKDASNEADGSTDNPYKASAIRLCMNRNRDENGNGVLDQEEMKWYVPTALQVNDISLCQFSYADPLLDFNSLYSKSENIINDTWGNTFVIMDEMIPLLKSGNLEGYNSNNANLYSNHTYVTSDYKKVGTQEVNNTKVYNESSFTSRPGQVRCVRNLGIAVDDQTITSPTSIINYDTDTHIFNQGLLESRSLRSEKAVRRELEPSTHISELNRPYRYFKVAQGMVQVNKGSNGWNSELHQALTNDAINPCRTYKDPDESDDKIGSWRAPNLSELVLMMSYDDTLPVNDLRRLLPVSDKYVFVCNTVWGFTPSATVWGRAFTTKKQKNANIWSTTLTDARYGSGHWQETYAQYNAKFRCVKDVDSPTE